MADSPLIKYSRGHRFIPYQFIRCICVRVSYMQIILFHLYYLLTCLHLPFNYRLMLIRHQNEWMPDSFIYGIQYNGKRAIFSRNGHSVNKNQKCSIDIQVCKFLSCPDGYDRTDEWSNHQYRSISIHLGQQQFPPSPKKM